MDLWDKKKLKKMAPIKIFKLRFLRPEKGFRPPLKGYLAKITYIFGRNDNFWKFSKFELSRSNFLRKTHFSGASCVALFWPTIFLASPNGGKKTLFYSFFHFWTKKIPPPFKLLWVGSFSSLIGFREILRYAKRTWTGAWQTFNLIKTK